MILRPILLHSGGRNSAPEADILGALTQRRDPQRENVEPVVEILPERALGDSRVQVAIGRGDHADVDLDRLDGLRCRSNSRSCSTRNSFTCTSGETSPISSRKIVPPLASSKRPILLIGRAGESALFVPEQFALDEPGRKRSAIHLDQRAVPCAHCLSARRG